MDTETRFWSIVDASGLACVPSDMWTALELIVRKAGHYDKLVHALHDAICSPKGVVPDSAEPYYRSSLCIGRGSAETPFQPGVDSVGNAYRADAHPASQEERSNVE